MNVPQPEVHIIESDIVKTWLVTGASAGLGAAIVREVLARGDKVIVSARNLAAAQSLAAQEPSRALPVLLDVTRPETIEDALKEALAWSPQIDVLVNNAGRGLHGAIEEVSDMEARALFDVNVFGLLSLTRAVLPHMRRRRSGHIINIGSVSGLASDAGTGLYSATKFALEGLSEAMRPELEPLGIKVTVLEPGPFRTEFNGLSASRAEAIIEDYVETAGKRVASLRVGSGKQPGDPAKAAAVICDIADREVPPLHLVLGQVALDRARSKLARLEAEMADWESVSRATSYGPDVA